MKSSQAPAGRSSPISHILWVSSVGIVILYFLCKIQMSEHWGCGKGSTCPYWSSIRRDHPHGNRSERSSDHTPNIYFSYRSGPTLTSIRQDLGSPVSRCSSYSSSRSFLCFIELILYASVIGTREIDSYKSIRLGPVMLAQSVIAEMVEIYSNLLEMGR